METETHLADNQEILVGPMLMLLRRMERIEMILDQLVRRGTIDRREIDLAQLRSTLNHAERTIRVRERCNKDSSDLEAAALTVRKEVESLEHELQLDPPV